MNAQIGTYLVSANRFSENFKIYRIVAVTNTQVKTVQVDYDLNVISDDTVRFMISSGKRVGTYSKAWAYSVTEEQLADRIKERNETIARLNQREQEIARRHDELVAAVAAANPNLKPQQVSPNLPYQKVDFVNKFGTNGILFFDVKAGNNSVTLTGIAGYMDGRTSSCGSVTAHSVTAAIYEAISLYFWNY